MKSGIFRSKFEERVFNALPKGTKHEPQKFKFPVASPLYRCLNCGTKGAVRSTSYLPDFLLPNGTFCEAKGRLTAGNRRNMVAFKAEHPTVVVRIVFQVDNVLYKGSTTRYSEWAKKAGFDYCVGIQNIKKEWLCQQ